MEEVKMGTIGAGPGGLRQTERSAEEAASELGHGAGVTSGGQERTGDVDEVAEWLGARRPV